VRPIKEIAVNDGPIYLTWYPSNSHSHSTGHSMATLAGRLTKHNQKIRRGVASSSDSKTTFRLDGMANSSNLQRERNCY